MQYDDTPPGPPPDWPVPGAGSWRAWHQPPGWLLVLALGAGIVLGIWAGVTWPALGTGPGDGTVAPPPPTTVATTVPSSDGEVTSTPARPPTTLPPTGAPSTTAPTTTQPPTTTAAPATTAPTTTGPPDSSDAEESPEAEPATTAESDQAAAPGGDG